MNFWATDPPADPFFDPGLDAWVVTRYHDVAAALRESRLIPVLARCTAPAVPIDSAVHADFRANAQRSLSPAAIEQWQERFDLAATERANDLSPGARVDLVESYARPLALAIAQITAKVPAADCARLAALSRVVFDSACEPFDEALAKASQSATVALATYFREGPPWAVQMFVALAQSLAAFLGNAWLALLDFPVAIADLPQAMEELLRFAGPAKAQFRQAMAPVQIRGASIAKDQRVILRLDVANRDPDEFPDPNALRFDRRNAHLAFGGGIHACVGAALVKSAAAAATKALFDRFCLTEHCAKVEDHFAVRWVSSLTAILSLPSQDPNRIDSRRP